MRYLVSEIDIGQSVAIRFSMYDRSYIGRGFYTSMAVIRGNKKMSLYRESVFVHMTINALLWLSLDRSSKSDKLHKSVKLTAILTPQISW